MEIGPVTAVRIAPMVSSIGKNPELPSVFEVGYSARTGDETYHSKAGNSTGGQDDDNEDDLVDDTQEESTPSRSGEVRNQVNFFA